MKKKKYLIAVLFTMIMLLSGCTKYLTDENKKRVVNEETGQAVTSNILCLPESESLLKVYEDNKDNLSVNYDSLKTCSEYSPSDISYTGLWETIFVKPLAWIIIKVGDLVANYGIAVMILGIVIRLILLPFTKKSLMQSENMKKAQPEIQAIQRKYSNVQDQSQMMQMGQEMNMVYKKYNVSPAGGCVTAFIQLPILLAFLEAINRVPAIFEGELLSLQLGTSPSVGIQKGNYLYIIIIILIIASTYFSYKNAMSANGGNDEQAKQMKSMMIFMIAFISIASLSLPTALALYWIVSNVFVIIQNFIVKKMLNKSKSSGKVKETKKEKFQKKGK